MNRAAKIDDSQRALVPLLIAHGATWQPTTSVGGGCPDGWIGYMGVDQAVEFKTGEVAKPRAFKDRRKRKGTRTEALQAEWHQKWKGAPRVILRGEAGCLALLEDMRWKARYLRLVPQ